MNIIRFDINLKTVRAKSQSITSYAKSRLAKMAESTVYEDYLENCRHAWRGIEQNNLSAIYNIEDLFGAGDAENIQYYLFSKTQTPGNKSNVSFIVVCIFKNEQVSQSLNIVIKRLKRVFSAWWNIGIKTVAIKRNGIYLYPCGEHDIYNTEVRVKGAFKATKWDDNRGEIFRDVLILLITAFVCIEYFRAENTSDWKSIYGSITVSGLFYLLSELLLVVAVNPKYKVVVEDLNSPLAGPDNPSNLNEPELTSPDV